jgi:RNA polymerase sigma-70 factor (ECF subfamily)
MTDADHTRFIQLLVRHEHDLLRFVLPLVGNLEDARDVMQEAAVNLWKKFDEYDSSQPFLPWARRFAYYAALMYRRKHRRFSFLTEELAESLAERQEQQELQWERRRQAMESCLSLLPDEDRRLLERRYADSKVPMHQQAAGSGQTANMLYKALARIRRQLAECVTRRLALADEL